jgi:hypothetical protein
MPLDPQRQDLAIGIVGTGVRGRGIAQIAAQAGIRVVLYDTRADAAAAAQEHVTGSLAKLAEKGKVPVDAARRAAAGCSSRSGSRPSPDASRDRGDRRAARREARALRELEPSSRPTACSPPTPRPCR